MNTPTITPSSAPGAHLIAVERVAKSVTGPQGELQILDDINFAIAARERLAVTGVSGSGKSTLLGLMAGLDTVSSGRITLLGHDLATLDEDGRAALRRDHVGFVFQAFHLVQSFTALENVMLPLELKGGGDARRVAAELLGRVGLGARMDHFPRQLSGGEQQRVALARAFCTSPAVLFADEPTGNLDARTAESVVELLFDLNDEFGTTLVIVTHDDRLAGACGRRIALDGGRIVGAS
ncbi:MAG: ABC transporter ATP-binding protein [Gammaproteobacteria bacterium]|nr:ABC transporter ATP-binding protein [Gammaproteobacteria bacterium]MCP5201706.1 ABC transporter ATP-binding protein [Gammaproteobacteria bacterium]